MQNNVIKYAKYAKCVILKKYAEYALPTLLMPSHPAASRAAIP
jgi:hypothetical protein